MSSKLTEMEHSKMDSETFIARPYQIELLNEIKKMNTILYLPTGSGKTYIATMLIKEMGKSLIKPLGKGRKWTIFVVQSVPLVAQHANSLRKHLPWKVGTFTGDMSVDYWSAEQWAQILDECHIMIMTAQIYLNNLHHGYMSIKDANLIIVDECHHATASHPFSQIMNVYHETFKLNRDSRPHILGLTATLINSNSKNVKEDLSKLQNTLDATIKTKHDKNIHVFSARPKELLRKYDENILDSELSGIIDRIKLFRQKIQMIKTFVNESIVENKEVFHFDSSKQPSTALANYFLDIEFILTESGVYTAYLATWHYIIEAEKKKKMCDDNEKYMILCMTLSEVTVIRKMLFDYMEKKFTNVESSLSLFTNASPKLKQLMQILTSIKRNDNCLVFVDRRTTAKVLYHYIKEYIHGHALQNNLACDFIVGTGGMLGFDSIESLYKKQQINDIIKNFNENIINVLITSEVLEEGVDIQTCNYVIRYDSPKNFPSYVQSKGRARSSASKFIVLVDNLLKFEKALAGYIKMNTDIEKILGENEIEDGNIIEDNDDHEVFKTKSATLTYDIAISIIIRYCYSLPHDCFTVLVPEWYFAENYVDKTYKCKLLLPINSAITTPIDGVFCKNKKRAKKSAAYYACIELYSRGVLDENLLPISIVNKSMFNTSKWFPHWNDEDIEACAFKLKPGTNKMKRIVQIKRSPYLSGMYPQENKLSYLHALHCVPKYKQLKDSKYEKFDELLKSNKEFGILTSKKLPSVSQFPIFLLFGDVDINIKVNVDKMIIKPESYKKLEQFHTKLFLDVLGVKKFVVRSCSNENDSYLIVPIYSSDGVYCVNWDVIDINTLVETEVPTKEKRKSKFYDDYLEKISVISPWYRNTTIQRYIVTDVYHNMTPESAFPTSDYDTYETYFKEKYNINVFNKNQPMIKVKSLGVSKINYLTPRPTGKIDKRSEFIEILVPEFCMWHDFPSVYWLKALMLPTILYRLSQLLLAEDLLSKVNTICNITVNNKSKDAIEMDCFCGFNEVNKNIILPIDDTLKYFKNSPDNLVHEWNSNNLPIDIDRQKNTTLLDVYNYHTFMHSNDSKNNNDALNTDSKGKSEDQDLEKSHSDNEPCKRITYAIYDMEKLEEINKLMKQSLPPSNIVNLLKKLNIFKNNNDFMKIDEILKKVLTEMNVLNYTGNESPILYPLIKQHPNQEVGPNQSDILKVITPPFANDMFNYERMETYGDSFLKFATSLALFDAFESENEGVLSEIKQKLVGNRNLCYVGKNLDIGSYLMVNIFEPTMDWIPPCFAVPQDLKDIIVDCDLSSDVLHQIFIPKMDQYSGKLSDETWVSIETEVMKFKKLSTVPIGETNNEDKTLLIGHSQSDLFLGKQSVSDKMVADCVESLIGIYVYKCGVEEGFKILHGLGIIPEEFIMAYKPKQIQNHKLYNSLDYSQLLPGYQILEKRIGYTFKHKHLLVQALTHPSYKSEGLECYQRLEFLGDAILDFLITTYIIEHCSNKTPGEITDIRSSLVNNITFASLSTRIGLHRFLLAQCVKLTEAIDCFFEHQQKNNFEIGQEVLYLIEESDCHAAESVDVPKALGDLFESLIAAIYIDCNRDLNFVWNICYKLMEKEINEFCTNVPKNPVRILNETKLQPNFSKPPAASQATSKGLNTMIQLDITVNNKIVTIYGFGQNKKQAKVAAAKMALKRMKKLLTS